MSQWTSLHTHTDASSDGMRPVSQLVKAASLNGMSHLGLTDHGTLANAVSFTMLCNNANIKPLIGCEGYIHVDGVVRHITLLADGDSGFKSLVALQNKAHASKQFNRPAFSVDDLITHNADLICLTGCVASPMNTLPYVDAVKFGLRLKAAFGNRLFAEVMTVGDQPDLWERPVRLANDLGLKLVCTNDVHFPYRDDSELHPILTRMRKGFDYSSKQLWLKTYDEITSRAKALNVNFDVYEALNRSFRIGEALNVVNLRRKQRVPEVEGAYAILRDSAYDAMKAMGFADNEAYKERLKIELDVIRKMSFQSYFLILKDVIDYARHVDVLVGPGRGSGAGSLTLFLLGITQVDPLVHGLSFERFLNVSRKTYPDVDVDFDSFDRKKVLEYAKEKWGAKPVVVFAHYSHKQLVHDLWKQFRLPQDSEKEAAAGGPNCDAFKREVDKNPLVGKAYKAILKQQRHRGKHAGGVVITDADVPIERAGDALVAAWSEGCAHSELSYAGIVKFDLLGLSALSVIKQLRAKYGNVASQVFENDAKEFSIFQRGDLAGIFQFSGSQGIKRLTMQVVPRTFDDIAVINALYRPGALDAGTASKYPAWKLEPRKIHPLIDDILEPTYGVIIYQEQVMAIYARVTGGGFADADNARRAIVKRKPGDADWERENIELPISFMSGAKERGIPEDIAEHLWQEILTHSRYSFNKSHAVAYAMVSCELAWWKYHHPAAFYACTMNVDPGGSKGYIIDAVSHGIDILPPRIETSGKRWTFTETQIFAPLSSIKFLGEAGVANIVSERAKAPFASLQDFVKRVSKRSVNARAKKNMVLMNVFKNLVGDERVLGVNVTASMEEPDELKQLECMGFVIPTQGLIQEVESRRKSGYVGGIIVGRKKKQSKWGDYVVYTFSPYGTFWSRDVLNLEVGVKAYGKVAKNGKAYTIEVSKK